MLRFSQRVVLSGHVPSGANALTGSLSPSPAIMTAVTRLTKSGAAGETTGGRAWVVVTLAGTAISCNAASEASTAAWFFATTASPLRP